MMLLAPMGAGADHLKALARVARLLRTDSVVDALRRSRRSGAALRHPHAAAVPATNGRPDLEPRPACGAS